MFCLQGGLVGADGATHHGSFDLSYVRCIPNMVVMTPSDADECRILLQTGLEHNGPALVRYPRGSAGINQESNNRSSDLSTVPLGKALLERRGKKVALLAFGPLLSAAREAADQLDATLVNMRFVKPIDVSLIRQLVASHELIVTIEDNAISGGAGSAVGECLHKFGLQIALMQLGLPDEFISHGDQSELLASAGLDSAGIAKSVLGRMRSGHPVPLR